MNIVISHIINTSKLSQQEAWWLLEHVTQQKKEALIASSYQLSPQEKNTLEQILIEIIQHHKPLAYCIGWVPFIDLVLTTKPPILIPRPETEEWVAQLIQDLQQYKNDIKTILDIGTGSGCIALALAQAFPHAHVVATDISTQALQLAQENAQQNNIANVSFEQSNLFSNLAERRFDLIVSNPPYIPPTAQLEPSVLSWEDPQALFAQDQGLHLLQAIHQQASAHLTPSPLPYNVMLEVDASHATPSCTDCTVHTDLFGNIRTWRCKQ